MDDNLDLPLFYHYTSLHKLKQILRAGLQMTKDEVKNDKFLRKSSYCSTLAPSLFSKSEVLAKHGSRSISPRKHVLRPQVCLVLVGKRPNLIRPISEDGVHFSFKSHKKDLFMCIQTVLVDDSLPIQPSLEDLLELLLQKRSVDILPLQFTAEQPSMEENGELDLTETVVAPVEAPVALKEGGFWNWILGLFSSAQ